MAGLDDPHPVQELVAQMTGPPADLRLDVCLSTVTLALGPGPEVDTVVARLDDLARQCHEPTLDGVRTLLFSELGFRGNEADYYDPANSMLGAVLDRRVGIPISLSAVLIEVGRRVGAPVDGVGLPGHFLVRDRVDPELFVDPFAGGRALDADGCAQLFRERYTAAGEDTPPAFDPDWLQPVPAGAIVVRTLANLVGCYRRRRDIPRLGRALELRTMLPGAAKEDHDAAARLLTRRGRFRRAAAVHHRLAAVLRDQGADEEAVVAERRRAGQLLARLN